ncbi:MAG: hypothetical protein EBZ69_00600 [Alphaproteobacteria bacterium]|nr:hypothetical protein [Alphaproteobacteria bacterium]
MKNQFVYPGSDLDRAKNLIALLGTFWSRTYTASDQLSSYVTATALTVAQTHRNTLEVAAALSRYDVPLFHNEKFVPIVIYRGQTNSAATNTAKFNRDVARFDGEIKFDVPIDDQLWAFPLPKNLANVAKIFNKITFPTVALSPNLDFYIDTDNHAIIFLQNPFENPGFLKRSVPVNGKEDEEITLWAFSGDYDYDYVFNQFAYALGIKLKTSQGYKDLTNAIFDSLIAGGASAKDIGIALAAICNIPVVIDQVETTEDISYDAYGLFIVTDRNIYRFAEKAEPVVSVGQRVFAGQPLIDGFDIIEFRPKNQFNNLAEDLPSYRQAVTDFLVTSGYEYVTTENDENVFLNTAELCPVFKKDLAALALDNGFVSACFYGDLVFENKEVPLIVDTDHPTKYTYVHFELNGLPSDVKKFFDEVHHRGIELARNQDECDVPGKKLGTLAHILDRRKYAETEPQPEHLPASINPLRFLVENVLRNNVFVVRITVSALGQNHLGLYNIRHLRQLLPPQTAMIVIFELGAAPDKVAAADNVGEAVSYFVGMEPATDNMPNENVLDLGATLSLISGTCH